MTKNSFFTKLKKWINEVKCIKEFDIFGYKIRCCSEKDSEKIPLDEIVDSVKERLNIIFQKTPHLKIDQAMTLLTLELAVEKHSLEDQYKVDRKKFLKTAQEALYFIEDTIQEETSV